jgi:hypothetical protein
MMDTSPRTHRFVSVDILTPSYRVVGKVMVTSTGVTGLLNDVTKSYMEVQDARLARIHMPTKLVTHYDMIRMVKSHLFVVCAARREDLGPTALVRGGYAQIIEYKIWLTTQVFELEGTLEWPGRFDFTAIMSDGTRDFVPIFGAQLTAILIPSLRVESEGMLFNRRQVDMLGLASQTAKD